ncbi:sigma-70 family RNA polymerase sigma factor [Roseiconus nitratireducens]|uniref:Sigma-70 family RNA polymerase sigma factor n=1 Tax=Roseiconus nitratireducens TaxID=2605748 RepID=A0A5M6D6B9_9BACT|nr:sigma-70 family RNA polymerase sigma factor [Roseiconus nitratireducens]KAA5543074.1 sigma-70 family RNA polymerase sigma factor [Roseiconus nitratireducens]
MSEVTQILQRAETGDQRAIEQLLPAVYDELRRLAAAKMQSERADHTLQPTELVHEAYLRLIGSNNGRHWEGSRHFCCAAAEAMRRILIDRARNGKRLKRGGDRLPVNLDVIDVAVETPDQEMIALDDAIDRLAQQFPDCAELVKLRFFGGFSLLDAASALGIPQRTAERKWAFARAWLCRELA